MAKVVTIREAKVQKTEVSRTKMYSHLREQLEGYGGALLTAVLSGSGAIVAWLAQLGPILSFLSAFIGGSLGLVGIWLRYRYQRRLEEIKRENEMEKLRIVLKAFEGTGARLNGPQAALRLAEQPPDIPVEESA